MYKSDLIFSLKVNNMSLILLKVNVARVKLQSRKTVDSSESLPLSNLDQLPVLTTCPKKDPDDSVLVESGYHTSLYNTTQFCNS